MTDYDKIYINGRWVASEGKATIAVHDSLTEQVMATIPEGTAGDVAKAAAAAKAAFESWSTLPAAERAKYMSRIGDALAGRMDEIASAISRETGMSKPLSNVIQVGLPLNSFKTAATVAESFPYSKEIGSSVVVREPIGVVGCITPWNYPLHQIAAKVAYAMATGCTVVLKPSEVAPINAFILAEVIAEVGLPAGVFNLVTGVGPVVGEAIAAHADVDMVSFTGSTRAGKRVAEVAAQTVKKVALELGGKSANVILDDADFTKAVADGVGKCFLNSGQTCTALTRMLVPRSRLAEAEQIAAATAAAFTPGNPFEKTSRLGPLVSDAQRERVRGFIRTGEQEGATLVTGGADTPDGLDKGYFVKPTVFSGVTRDMTIAREEIFGPVLAILTFRTVEEAIEKANNTAYGLSAGVWTDKGSRILKMSTELKAGVVWANTFIKFDPTSPFGGYKESGFGREGGRQGLLDYANLL
mgnify:CR=1 FL=1